MQVKERFCQFIRLLTDSKPKGVTDEEWKVIRDEREAKKRKQAELERYATLKKRRSIGTPDG